MTSSWVFFYPHEIKCYSTLQNVLFSVLNRYIAIREECSSQQNPQVPVLQLWFIFISNSRKAGSPRWRQPEIIFSGREDRKYGLYLHTSSPPHSCEKERFVLMWRKNRGPVLEEIVSLFDIVFASLDRAIQCLSDCSVTIFFYFSFCPVKCFISFCCAFRSCIVK